MLYADPALKGGYLRGYLSEASIFNMKSDWSEHLLAVFATQSTYSDSDVLDSIPSFAIAPSDRQTARIGQEIGC